MSLFKAIKYRKEKRKPYVGKNYCKLVDPTCRNHGTCLYCLGNRLHKSKRLDEETKSKMKEGF
jgi:hypothetical protein